MTSIDSGIHELELVPQIDDRAIIERLIGTVRGAESLRAAIAYWTVDPNQVPGLGRVLSGEGFLCVDLHLPTDIDHLVTLSRAGANVYLHTWDPVPATEPDTDNRVPSHLLHPKLLLLDFQEDTSELWVGSHNWTNRALGGLNIEASLVATLSTATDLYREAATFLAGARQLCEPFDPSKADYYKWLQGRRDQPVSVVTLGGQHLSGLASTSILLTGVDPAEHASFKSVGNELLVLCIDDQARAYTYSATVSKTGLLTSADRQAPTTLPKMRWALHKGVAYPELLPAQPFRADDVPQSKYYAQVELSPSAVAPADLEIASTGRSPKRFRVTKDERLTRGARLDRIRGGQGPVRLPLPYEQYVSHRTSAVEAMWLERESPKERKFIQKMFVPEKASRPTHEEY